MSDKRRFSDMDSKSGASSADHPPYSRLFIVCNKSITEECLSNEFGKFGTIEEVWMVKDRNSGESKGVAYIKYALTSEAAKAVEEMNGKHLNNIGRPIKVLIAHSRGEGSKKEPLEEERLLRLFVCCKKNALEQEIDDHFRQFGEIDSIKLVKHRDSNENKGFAYVKFFKMSHAALAYENCNRSYRPKFAEPKPHPSRYNNQDPYDSVPSSFDDNRRFQIGHNSLGNGRSGFGPEGSRLQVMVSPVVTQSQLNRIFDIAPGLDFCILFTDFRAKNPNERIRASVTYNTPQQAAYARDKLHGFEYPPGQPMLVRADMGEQSGAGSNHHPTIPPFPVPSNPAALSKSDIALLAENVKQATALLKAHTNLSGISPASYDPHYCTAKLPPPRQFDDEEPATEGNEPRIFVVFNPSIPERYAIKDVFGRFGRILDLFLLAGKNVGYITYPRMESVTEAIAALHGQELCGMYMKVMPAEPRRSGSQPDDDRRKRLRMQSDE